MLVTVIHTYTERGETNRLKGDFRIMVVTRHGTSKRVNPSKSQFRKFDPKSIFSLPYMGKKKVEEMGEGILFCCLLIKWNANVS